MKPDELLEQIRNLTYRTSDNYELRVISADQFHKVEQIIRQFFLDNHDAEMGELKAKVYAYERIIANSNFAPVIEKPDSGLFIKVYADSEPQEKAEKLYQICEDRTELMEVLNELKEYCDSYENE